MPGLVGVSAPGSRSVRPLRKWSPSLCRSHWDLHRSHSTACGFLVGEKRCWTGLSGGAGTGRQACVTGAPAASLPRAAPSRVLSRIPANRGFIASACVCSTSPSLPPPSLVSPLQAFYPCCLWLYRAIKREERVCLPSKALGPQSGQGGPPGGGLPRRERALSIL